MSIEGNSTGIATEAISGKSAAAGSALRSLVILAIALLSLLPAADVHVDQVIAALRAQSGRKILMAGNLSLRVASR